MKRIISGILIIALLCTLCCYAFADKTEKYSYLPVEFQGTGRIESLSVMVKGEHLYVDAEQLGSRLGYDTSVTDDRVSIYNNDKSSLLYGLTVFNFGSSDVLHLILNEGYNYTAPFESIKNERGAWVPLQYALLMLRSSILTAGETALISMPQADITDYFRYVIANSGKINFDYAEDFEIADEYVEKIGTSSSVTNVCSDALGLYPDAIKGMFKNSGSSFSAYDYKYANELATMFCTNSNDEKDASVEAIGKMSDALGYNETLSDTLSKTVKDKDVTVGTLSRACEALKDQVDNNNTALLSYNKTYEQLEKVIDSQSKLSKLDEWVSGFADSASDVGTILGIIGDFADYANHLDEWCQQDEFAVEAIQEYLSESTMISDSMRKNMSDTAETMKADFVGYTSNYIADNLLLDKSIGAVQDAIKQTLGAPVAIELLVWDIVSGFVPFYRDGLKAADKFELSMYSTIFQYDAFNAYVNCKKQALANPTTENMQKTAELCYAYLKAAYITRAAAIAYADNISHNEDTAKLVEEQRKINTDIAAVIAEIKSACGTSYGFLLENSKECVANYDDSGLIKICSDDAIASDKLLTGIKVRDDATGNITRSYDFIWDKAGRLSSIKLTENDGYSYIYTVKYDDAGRILSAIYGEPVDTYSPGENSGTIYTYGDNGLIESDLSWEGGFGETHYTYDANNKLIKTVGDMDFVTETTVFSYDADGLLKSKTKTSIYNDEIDMPPIPDETTTYKYDAEGRCIEEKSDSEYGINSKYSYDYKMFAVKTDDLGNYDSSSLELLYNNKSIYSVLLGEDVQFCADDDGYLAYIYNFYDNHRYTYEFYYDGNIAKASTQVGFDSEWKQLYYNALIKKEIDNMEFDLYDESTYELLYLNDDDIPELFIGTSFYYSGSQIVSVYDGNLCSTVLPYGTVRYIPSNNILHVSSGHQGLYPDTVYSMKNGKLQVIESGYNTERVGNGELIGYDYFWNDTAVTEKEYNHNIDKLIDPDEAVYAYSESMDDITTYTYKEMLIYLSSAG